MSDIYSIVNIEKYAMSMRKNAALSLGEDSPSQLDQYISIPTVIDLIKNNSLGVDEDNNPTINEDAFNDTFDEVRAWIEGVVLARLAAEDKIECAWDDKTDEMIFWTKQKDVTNN